MTAPEVKGMVRLSSGPKGRASAAAATTAPIKTFQKGTRERARPIAHTGAQTGQTALQGFSREKRDAAPAGTDQGSRRIAQDHKGQG